MYFGAVVAHLPVDREGRGPRRGAVHAHPTARGGLSEQPTGPRTRGLPRTVRWSGVESDPGGPCRKSRARRRPRDATSSIGWSAEPRPAYGPRPAPAPSAAAILPPARR
jgi:hypothetical protein